jgi:hypothetical protein
MIKPMISSNHAEEPNLISFLPQLCSVCCTVSGAIAVVCVLSNAVETLQIKEQKMANYQFFESCSNDYVQVLPQVFEDMENSNLFVVQSSRMSYAILFMDIAILVLVCLFSICAYQGRSVFGKRNDDNDYQKASTSEPIRDERPTVFAQ